MSHEAMTQDQGTKDVLILAERLAMLYHYFVKVISEELGEERALTITDRVIAEYGADCGRRTKANVEACGLPNDLLHHHLGGDLPSRGWKVAVTELDAGHKVIRTNFCPLAAVWQELGHPDWGRHYCWVDQAKYTAYNEDFTCEHLENILDGAPACLMRVALKE